MLEAQADAAQGIEEVMAHGRLRDSAEALVVSAWKKRLLPISSVPR
ncbi:hypothetical protein [Microbulbifer epialgicus]|uniref:Uncharacterized protein n=1 Tax=Microbulbifer epialgicus TaxID=393907 RepID=A0ABV4P2N8_9GAMM